MCSDVGAPLAGSEGDQHMLNDAVTRTRSGQPHERSGWSWSRPGTARWPCFGMGGRFVRGAAHTAAGSAASRLAGRKTGPAHARQQLGIAKCYQLGP